LSHFAYDKFFLVEYKTSLQRLQFLTIKNGEVPLYGQTGNLKIVMNTSSSRVAKDVVATAGWPTTISVVMNSALKENWIFPNIATGG
jgi:hypothetical protein